MASASFNQGINPNKDGILRDFDNGIYRKSLYVSDDTLMSVYDLEVRNEIDRPVNTVLDLEADQAYSSVDIPAYVNVDHNYNSVPLTELSIVDVPARGGVRFENVSDKVLHLAVNVQVEVQFLNAPDKTGNILEAAIQTDDTTFPTTSPPFFSKDSIIGKDFRIVVQQTWSGVGSTIQEFLRPSGVFTLSPGKSFWVEASGTIDFSIEAAGTFMRVMKI